MQETALSVSSSRLVSESASHDPNRVVSSMAERGLKLELQTIDLCLLAALYLRAERAALTSFSEEQLTDVFDQVEQALSGKVDAPKRRSAHAIRRLREQRMIARVDGAGI